MKKDTLHEIIHVVQPAFLVNSARHACRYETADCQPLALGYYFALWPANATAKVYDRRVRYFGPFATEDEALLVRDCAQYLHLVVPTATTPRPSVDARLTAAVRATYGTLMQAVPQPDRRAPRCAACR